MYRQLGIAAVTAVVANLTLQSVAQAAEDCTWVDRGNNEKQYVCTEGGDPINLPGGQDGDAFIPACEFDGGFNEVCDGENPCWVNDPAAVQDPQELEGTPKPSEDSYVVYWSCQGPDGTYDRWFWNDDQPTITIEDRIRSAMGAIELPTIEASSSPPVRTLINLETWFWAEDAPEGAIIGSEALGMRAIASPRGMTVDPGIPGVPPKSCPLAVTESDACSFEFGRAGTYTATVSIVYDLSFELNGEPVETDIIPEDLRTVTVEDSTEVDVVEVQTRVIRVR